MKNDEDIMMGRPNPIFKENYGNYLRQLEGVDLSLCESVLGVHVEAAGKTTEIPFFNTRYRVSRFGVVDDRGRRPGYGTCVILLKYLLMCPNHVPPGTDWVSYRDFKDAGRTQDVSLIDYAMAAISNHYAGNRDLLSEVISASGGKRPDTEYPYDLSAVFTVLPRVPVLLLFNDAEPPFPARTLILFERRAEHFLDAECLVMVCLALHEHLKRAEK
jgi:hypothetical protein